MLRFPGALPSGFRKDPYLLIESFALALGFDAAEIIERCMDKPSLEGIHRIEKTGAACAPYLSCGPVRGADDLLLVPHPVVLAVYDDFDIRIEIACIDVRNELDGIKILSLASDDYRRVIA